MDIARTSEFGIGSLTDGNFSMQRAVRCVKTYGSVPC